MKHLQVKVNTSCRTLSPGFTVTEAKTHHDVRQVVLGGFTDSSRKKPREEGSGGHINLSGYDVLVSAQVANGCFSG